MEMVFSFYKNRIPSFMYFGFIEFELMFKV